MCKKTFESGDKTGKILALRLKQIESSQAITSIRRSDGSVITDSADIN